MPRAEKPFVFLSQLTLLELTGKRARSAEELLEGIREAPEAAIYHHTHHYLQQHQVLSPEPPNDFADWVTEALGESNLGEKLAAIDIGQCASLEELRRAIIECLEQHLARGQVLGRWAAPGREFQFAKAITFALPTGLSAVTLREFLAALLQVTSHSLYYHMFYAKLGLGKTSNDFSAWLSSDLGEVALAQAIALVDRYTHTMEGLRHHIARLIEKRLEGTR